jgi:tetratricopeptide (TPR) repeat protein
MTEHGIGISMNDCRTSAPASGPLVRFAHIALAAICLLAAHTDELARGDSEWGRRGEGQRDGQPQPGPILAAVDFYEAAVASRPSRIEARWKLLRALHFAGDFASPGAGDRRAIFERATQVSELALTLLAEQVAAGARLDEMEPETLRSLLEGTDISTRDVARLHFWSAISWGAWSRDVGLVNAVRQGVANRLYRYTRVTIALEPDYEEGGALRLLGRLHAELPRVPFVSGWVDRQAALPLIERAYALAPTNPGNRLLLALTLLDLAPPRRAEALELLGEVANAVPRPEMLIEDLQMQEQARDRLRVERDRVES